MTSQRILLRLFRAGLLRGPVRRVLERRSWTIETGEAAGLKLSFSENAEFILGSSELPMQRSIASHLRPGDVFYDVGANIGFFSLLATRRVGPNGAVYSFEPVSENVATIRTNTRLNAFTNVSVFEVAVDAQSGTGNLSVTQWDGGSSLIGSAGAPLDTVQQRSVRVVALDDLIVSERLRPPTLVKIDVEGAELGVIRGMLETISRFKPVLIYEVDDPTRSGLEQRWRELDDVVSNLGYRVTHLESSYPNVNWHVGHSMATPATASNG